MILGYIYVRVHESYNDACKLGMTNNIPDRDSQYATGEMKRGYFDMVFEVEHAIMIERLLQYEFKSYNIKYDAGTEFYNKKIISLIEPYLMLHNFKYKLLSKQEINNLNRSNRLKNIRKKINIPLLIQSLKTIKYIPREDQKVIVDNSVVYFNTYNKGILLLTCGVGKTLISLWISQKLNSKTILIGVPNTLLLKQWEQVVNVLFPGVPILIVSENKKMEDIKIFMKKNKDNCIVITTYASCYKVKEKSKDISFVFDMKINDEVHHLTSSHMIYTNTKKYIHMLNIDCMKQISLTATLKHLESAEVSNDNVRIFGGIIEERSLLWAIHEGLVCDYVIQNVTINDCRHEFKINNIIEENDKRLFLSAFASLKSIKDGDSHHLLIYSNNQKHSDKIIKYIKKLLKDNYFYIPDLFCSSYYGVMKPYDKKQIIHNFEKSKFGIISCVYCLGEGWDFPLLDGVVFAENMTSNIRIVQSALRASRKNKKEITKQTKIILPILDKENWFEDNENPDFKKVKEVIYQMGLEDENIIHKIKASRINIEKQPRNQDKNSSPINDYDDELTKVLRLKTTNRCALGITYAKAKKIIEDKHIKNKEQYYALCDNDIRLSKEPEIVYKGQFTNWIDYLSIKRIYYDLETCKHKVDEYVSSNAEIRQNHLELSNLTTELCKLDELFPPNELWVEYYGVNDLRDIIRTTNKKKKKTL